MSFTPPIYHGKEIIFENFQFSELTHPLILANSSSMPDTGAARFFTVYPEMIGVNTGSFTNPGGTIVFPTVIVEYRNDQLALSCCCNQQTNKLCEHMVQVLYNIMERPDLGIFFDAELRYKTIREVAKNYGLQNETNLDEHFELSWIQRTVSIAPRIKTLQPVSNESLQQLSLEILPVATMPAVLNTNEGVDTILVFSEHKYYKHLQVTLYYAATGAGGKIKNPLEAINPQHLAWQSNDVASIKFFTGVAGFINNHNKPPVETDLQALRAIANNPLGLKAFYHNPLIAENISPASLVPIQLNLLSTGLELRVYLKGDFYEISGQLSVGDKTFPLNNLPLKYGYFVLAEAALHLVCNADLLRVMAWFKKNNNIVLVHQSKFEEFRKTILARLEDTIRIHYAWLVTASKEQLEENGFDTAPQQLMYLSDAGVHVTIGPVMRYGEIEVSILSKKQLYARDQKDNAFIVERDEVAENNFTALLLKQHPDFEEQLHQQEFYLTKKQFLEDAWFLDAIEEWERHHIKVLGFNEIGKNRLNAHKGKVSVKVTSGLDWFNTDLEVRYGKQKASLRQLHKSIKNGSKYVTLDDGTLGILPAEWIKKMAAYFEAGNIDNESIRTPKINFAILGDLYEKEMLDQETQQQVDHYAKKLAGFESVESVPPPAGLHTELRHYQQQGLNWLNFLDDFGFGGCLADDMGLGKTIQVIAFMLLLRKKHGAQTHLVVVPASLIFNWQEELERFAPSLTLLTIDANNRVKNNHHFKEYDIVLTSYGMVVSNIHFMKAFHFGYIFLDESQAIKNPDSQRYKAVKMLQSKNKMVITGTPIENNTFDLYGQCLSPARACWATGNILKISTHSPLINLAIAVVRWSCSKRSTPLFCAAQKNR